MCCGREIDFNSFLRTAAIGATTQNKSYRPADQKSRQCPMCRNVIYQNVVLTNLQVFCPICRKLVKLPC